MRIYSANNVFIEVTRRCNMCCAHCLRGDAESIDVQEKYIDAFLDNFEKGAYISSLTFTGGEISLNIPAIRYTLKAVKERGIAVGSFYMVTNGKAVDKMADLAMASLEWWAYCDEKDDYMCGLCISSDNFHEAIPYESESILSGLKYNRNDKVTDFHLAYLLNEGRAKNLDSNIYKKREPHVDKLEYEFNKTGDIDFYSGELYLNAIGDVVSGCDWSYKSQKKYRFGNVMNKMQKRSKKTKTNPKTSRAHSKKRFGKSIGRCAPALFITILGQKASRCGGSVIKVSTFETKASQFDHTDDSYTKKKLSQRFAKLSDGTIVQRDLYSAFLLLHLRKNLQSYNKKTIKKDFPQFKKLHDKTKERLQNSHEWLPCSVGF